jgi:hypothetical protein
VLTYELARTQRPLLVEVALQPELVNELLRTVLPLMPGRRQPGHEGVLVAVDACAANAAENSLAVVAQHLKLVVIHTHAWSVL